MLHGLRSVLFILLAVVLLAPAYQAPTPTAAQPGASTFGVNSHLGSRHGTLGVVDEALSALDQSEAGWVREEFQWGLIDPNRSGEYLPGRWDFMDTVIEAQHAQGFNIIGLLNDAPGNAPPDTARFVSFVRDVVQRYPQIQYWEVWNEPENPLYWNNPDPAAYTTLLKAVSQAIREENPNAKIISAGIVPTHAEYLRAIHTHGGWDAFDIVGIHPYVDPFTPETGQIGVGGDVSKILSMVRELGNKPVWATEYGWSTGPSDRTPDAATPEEQANYLVRGAVLLRAAGVERVLWYNFKDENANRRNEYGLFAHGSGRTDFTQPKPAFAAFRALNQQLAGTTSASRLPIGDSTTVLNFEQTISWEAGPPMGSLTHTPGQGRNGSTGGTLSYTFNNSGDNMNDWVGLSPAEYPAIEGRPTRMGIWVNGNGHGHELKVWLLDAEGEVLQFRLGIINDGGWRFVSTPIDGEVEEWNQMKDFGTVGNRRLDYPIKLRAIIYDDNPNEQTGSGSITLDDLTAMSSSHGVRFEGGSNVVDVLWAMGNEQVQLPSNQSVGTLIDRWGEEQTVNASNGAFTLNLSESPVYMIHSGGPVSTPPPTPEDGPDITPTPTPGNGGGNFDDLPNETRPGAPDGSFAHSAMESAWQRPDLPVLNGAPGMQPRSWIWGDAPITAPHTEAYAEGNGGQRTVQYFAKSRMEVNDLAQGIVTNGLLSMEMIEGRIQVGDSSYVDYAPSNEAVAGDPAKDNPNAPTYRSFRSVSFPVNEERAPDRTGQVVTTVLNRDGSTSENADLASYNVTNSFYADQLGHNIPNVFIDFLNQRGVVYENGSFSQQQIIDWLFVTGYPISEPYWARVRVGGVEKDVLMQAFQRRVLTYTPSNDPAWRVEMGNVGQHYLRWRYGE